VAANPQGFHWRAVTEDIATVLRIARVNGPLMRVFGCMIVSSLAFTMTNKCLTYYVNHWLERPDLRAWILPLALFVNLVFCLVWAGVAQRTSKRRAWLMANAVSLVAYLAFWYLPTRDPLLAAGLVALISVGNAAYLTLVWAMLPDTVEYTQWKTGQRHDAKVFGVASFAKQLALGLNGFLLGWLLSAVGYVEQGGPQTDAAIEGLRAIMSLVPLAGIALSALLIWGYPLDTATHDRITRDLEARRT
jgi:GPH family glycoside/pentoside/hexuronide:cation symporter